MIIDEVDRPKVQASQGMGLQAWLASDDRGLSSDWMAHIMFGVPNSRPWGDGAYPHDPSDFGRCYRFLEAVPGARSRLDMMRDSGRIWNAYITHWKMLETLYLEELPSGRCTGLYKLMNDISEKGE